jgi:hypothetical protein
MSATTMARRKTSAAASAKGQKANKRIVVQAMDEWIAWVERGAEFCRTDVSKLVDSALIDYLRARGFEEKPPKRVP